MTEEGISLYRYRAKADYKTALPIFFQAEAFGFVTAVHKDVTERLKVLNNHLYLEVKKILEMNKQERHIRGGKATKEKYLKLTKAKKRIS